MLHPFIFVFIFHPRPFLDSVWQSFEILKLMLSRVKFSHTSYFGEFCTAVFRAFCTAVFRAFCTAAFRAFCTAVFRAFCIAVLVLFEIDASQACCFHMSGLSMGKATFSFHLGIFWSCGQRICRLVLINIQNCFDKTALSVILILK